MSGILQKNKTLKLFHGRKSIKPIPDTSQLPKNQVKDINQVNPVRHTPTKSLQLSTSIVKEPSRLSMRRRSSKVKSRSLSTLAKTAIDLSQKLQNHHSSLTLEHSLSTLEREYTSKLHKIEASGNPRTLELMFQVSQDVFQKLIEVDRVYARLLAKIKTNYENYIRKLTPNIKNNSVCSSVDTLTTGSASSDRVEMPEIKKKRLEKVLRALNIKEISIEEVYELHCREILKPSEVQPQSVPMLALPKTESQPGFHDEFMAKFDEFSASWRALAR